MYLGHNRVYRIERKFSSFFCIFSGIYCQCLYVGKRAQRVKHIQTTTNNTPSSNQQMTDSVKDLIYLLSSQATANAKQISRCTVDAKQIGELVNMKLENIHCIGYQ